MPAWLSAALWIAVPCLLALIAYDFVAIYLLATAQPSLVPLHEFARGILQDLGLALVYAVTVTPRVINRVAADAPRARRLTLLMLGLGLAWYDVLCAFATRSLAEPPGILVSLVVLFLIPVMLAPPYVRWLKTKVPQAS